MPAWFCHRQVFLVAEGRGKYIMLGPRAQEEKTLPSMRPTLYCYIGTNLGHKHDINKQDRH